MNTFIRWQGLLGFIVFSALIAGIWLIIAPFAIKYAIEDYGSKAVGAKVEVSSVSISFNPLGLVIQGLQIADASQPMQNAVEVFSIQTHVALGPLLQGKVIVKNLEATGLAFATPRTTSGTLVKEKDSNEPSSKEATTPSTSLLSDKLPSGAEILAREPLSTVATGKALQDGLQQSQADIKQIKAGMPTAETINQYKAEMAAIQKNDAKTLADYQAKQKQLSALKQKMRANQQAINQAAQTVQSSRTTLQNQFSALKQAPTQDFNTLMAKYQRNGNGAANVSQLLFGDDVSYWVKQAVAWHKKISPYLQSAKAKAKAEEAAKPNRLEGRFVAFPTAFPTPNFLVEKASLSIHLPQGDVVARLNDVTNEQDITKRPTTININSNALQDMKSLAIDGVFDLRQEPAQNIVNVNIDDWLVNNYKLGGESLSLQQANTKVVSTIKLNPTWLNVTGSANFAQANFASKAESKYGQSLAKILANIHSFELAAQVSGDINQPSILIKSDLDKQIKSAVTAQLNTQKDKLAKELKAGLNEKMLSYAGSYEQQLRQLDLQNASIASAKTDIENLLSSELSAFKDEKTTQAKDKAADKVKGKLGGLKL